MRFKVPEEAYELNFIFTDGDGAFDNNNMQVSRWFSHRSTAFSVVQQRHQRECHATRLNWQYSKGFCGRVHNSVNALYRATPAAAELPAACERPHDARQVAGDCPRARGEGAAGGLCNRGGVQWAGSA